MILRETFRLFRSTVWQLIPTVMVASLLLALGYTILLGLHNLIFSSEEIKQGVTLDIYIADDAEESRITELKTMLESNSEVVAVSDKSPEEALEEMSSILGSDLTEVLGYNPLPRSLEVRFSSESANVSYLGQLAADIAARDEVFEVQYAAEWLNNFSDFLVLSERIAITLSALLAVGVLLIFINIQGRIAIERRGSVRTLLLLGASPNVGAVSLHIWSIVMGLLSSGAAIFIVWGLWRIVSEKMLEIVFFERDQIAILILVPVLLAVLSAMIKMIRSRGK